MFCIRETIISIRCQYCHCYSYHLTVLLPEKLFLDYLINFNIDPFLTLSRKLRYIPFEKLKMKLLEFVVCPFCAVRTVQSKSVVAQPQFTQIKKMLLTFDFLFLLLYLKSSLYYLWSEGLNLFQWTIMCLTIFFSSQQQAPGWMLHFVTVFIPWCCDELTQCTKSTFNTSPHIGGWLKTSQGGKRKMLYICSEKSAVQWY